MTIMFELLEALRSQVAGPAEPLRKAALAASAGALHR